MTKPTSVGVEALITRYSIYNRTLTILLPYSTLAVLHYSNTDIFIKRFKINLKIKST